MAVGWTAEPIWLEDPMEEPMPENPFQRMKVPTMLDLYEMVEIPAGKFLMGSSEDEQDRLPDEQLHDVTLAAFRMAATAVTREQYQSVMGIDSALEMENPKHPVTDVSWFDAITFCNRASKAKGLDPSYQIIGRYVRWNPSANGYRLPTEAEWEYAARAGNQTRWFYGDEEQHLGEYAWFEANSYGQCHPVGELKPNAWGLYDMHGNVWEWCWDVYGSYPRLATQNPRGPGSWFFPTSKYRVLRGGSFQRAPGNLRSAHRDRSEPNFRFRLIGFRCVCGAPP